MSSTPPSPSEADPPKAPAKLVAALKGLESENRVAVPESVDQAILAGARAHLEGNKVIRFPRFVPWIAAAAAAVLVLFASRPVWQGMFAEDRREDLDRNGQVDIRDALFLAQHVRSGGAFDQRLDMNGDGVLDNNDINAVAAEAVSLEKRS